MPCARFPDMDRDDLLDVEEEAIGTDALNPDTDGDGFDDGEGVLLMETDPLDPTHPPDGDSQRIEAPGGIQKPKIKR